MQCSGVSDLFSFLTLCVLTNIYITSPVIIIIIIVIVIVIVIVMCTQTQSTLYDLVVEMNARQQALERRTDNIEDGLSRLQVRWPDHTYVYSNLSR